jgi:hypothetical protein
MAIADRDFRRDGLFANRARLPTAGRKGAAGRQLGKVGWGNLYVHLSDAQSPRR